MASSSGVDPPFIGEVHRRLRVEQQPRTTLSVAVLRLATPSGVDPSLSRLVHRRLGLEQQAHALEAAVLAGGVQRRCAASGSCPSHVAAFASEEQADTPEVAAHRRRRISGVAASVVPDGPPPLSLRAAAARTRNGRARTRRTVHRSRARTSEGRPSPSPEATSAPHLQAFPARQRQRRPPVLILVVDDDRLRPEQLLQLLEAVLQVARLASTAQCSLASTPGATKVHRRLGLQQIAAQRSLDP